MISVILMILKLIGILILLILLLFFLLLGVILFVPLRYEAGVNKSDDDFSAAVNASWLLRMISVRAVFKTEGREIIIRILGRSLDDWNRSFHSLRDRRNGRRNAPKRSRPEQKHKQLKQEQIQEQKKEDPIPQKPKEKDQTEVHSEPDRMDQNTIRYDHKTARQESEYRESPENDSDTDRTDRFQKRIRILKEKMKNGISGLNRGLRRLQHFPDRLEELPDKIESVYDTLQELELSALAGDLLEELKRLMKHYRPESLTGSAEFGTGDPALTGQLTGVLYCLLPAGAEFELLPDFHEAVFRTDAAVKGKIRIVHLIPTGWRLYKNQRLRRAIHWYRSERRN